MLVSLGWVLSTILDVLMFIFDTPIYGIAIVCINVFNGIARMDFFSTDAGASMYSDISRRIYAILGILMIFFFSYQLIMLIINPDGDKKASSGLVKTTITSLIMIAFLPTLYKYMAYFQEHVLTEGTIPAIVLGQGASGGDSDKSGRNTALIVYLSMYHPGEGGYNSIVNSDEMDANGDAQPHSLEHCVSDSGANEETCQLWLEGYNDFLTGTGFGGITAFSRNSNLSDTIDEDGGSTYYVVIIAICGIVLIWFYGSYALDLGYRTIKLGFLQIITPGPVIMRIFPKTAKTFEKWKHELIRTYLDIFVRIFIISFVIAIIQKIPAIIAGLFSALKMAGWCIPFGIVAMIFGVLKFGKEIPKLIKDIFDNGSGLLSGLDWKPGIGRRLQAGKDDVVGFGKKMAGYGRNFKKGINKGVGAVMNAPFTAKRGYVKAGGFLKGGLAGAAGAIKSNQSTGFRAIKDGLAGFTKGSKAGITAGNAFNPVTDRVSDGFKLTTAAGKDAGSTAEGFRLRDYLGSFKKQFEFDSADARSLQIDKIKGEISSDNKAMSDKTGYTDKKSKSDAFIKNEIDKARDFVRNGGDIRDYQARDITKSGDDGGIIKFNSLTELEKHYSKKKKEILGNTLKDSFTSNTEGASKLFAETAQGTAEKFSSALALTTDVEKNAIVGEVGKKITKDDLKYMLDNHIITQAEHDDNIQIINNNKNLSTQKETLKIEREQLEITARDIEKRKDAVYNGLANRIGTLDENGVEITQDYIDNKINSLNYDSQLDDLRRQINDKTTQLNTLNLTSDQNLTLSSDNIAEYLSKASDEFSKGNITNADTASRIAASINDISTAITKGISKNVSHIDFGTAAAGSGGSSDSGNKKDDKK